MGLCGTNPSLPPCQDAAVPGEPVPCPALPTCIPKDCASAPKTVTIPKEVNDTFGKLWGESLPGGKSQEQGGIIVQNKEGKFSVVNTGSGDSGSFSPNRNIPGDTSIAGIFHTHPYDASEGGHTGVAFSGADIAIAVNNREPSYVQSGDRQFMIMPTLETPKEVDYAALDKAQNARIAELVKAGKGMPEASRQAAKETAQKYKMAYYEGKDGVLDRVSC